MKPASCDGHAEETTTGTVYVNLPTGSADIDSLTISGDGLADVTVQLGN